MSKNRKLTLLLVGDVFVCREDPPSAFQHVKDLISGADFALGNLEGSVADSGTPSLKASGSNWKADARQIAAVGFAGFDAMNVANNHMMDFGSEALLETIAQLDRLGILHTGGGRNFAEAHTPALVEREGCRVAMLGYTSVFMDSWRAGPQSPGLAVIRAHTAYQPPPRFFEAPGTPPIIRTWAAPEDKAQLSADIAAARGKADIVICTFHWGVSQGFKKICDYQIELAHHAIDAGADLVFGHHPHLIQGIEVYDGRAIFYSLGNFTFAHHNLAGGHELETLMVRCVIQDRRIEAVEYLPVRCDDGLNPHVLDLTQGRDVVYLVNERSAQFSTKLVAKDDAVRVPISVHANVATTA